jgi:resuscitation-promoting factor RpfC
VKNIYRAAKKALWLAAIAATLAIVPMMLSTATAHADTVNWDAIAQCESGGKWSTNTGNGFSGGLQFKPATWASHGGVGSPATASREEQIRVAERVLASQGLGAWPKCGPRGLSPVAWNTPSAPLAPSTATGCQVIGKGSLFGIVDLRQLCSSLLTPLAGLGQR